MDYAHNGYEPPGDLSDIDVDYADAVMGALGAAESEAWAGAAVRGALDERLRRDLTALVGEQGADAFIASVEQNGGVEALRAEPDGSLYRATDVVDVGPECLALAGSITISSFLEGANDTEPAQFLLMRDEARRGSNPTPWVLVDTARESLNGFDVRLSCEAL